MTDLRLGLTAARELGVAPLFHLARYRIGLMTGRTRRRTPVGDSYDDGLGRWLRPDVPAEPEAFAARRVDPAGPRFFFDAAAEGLPAGGQAPPPKGLRREADDVLAGRFRMFGRSAMDRGFPPEWNAFPPPLESRAPLADTRHWSEIPLDEPASDVRLVWELSRFGWVFLLGRAYRWTGERKYAEAGWTLVEDWCRANPPNRGIHWASAQEVGLRILALAFAERVFFPAWRREARRIQFLASAVRWHAARIPPTVDYGRAQGNNHLLSEAAGLYTAGLLFPELRESERWKQLGRDLFEDGYRRQVFSDGGYVQHSANYHRLALALGVWTARLAAVNGEPFPSGTIEAIGRLAQGLAAQADSDTGRAPCFGPDDSSDILPLSSADASDVRPFAAAAGRLFLGEEWYPPGAWDETSLWLGAGAGAQAGPPRPESLNEAGIHFLRGASTWGSLRCVEFHERPGHSDQLHVDLWSGGRPFTLDPGSYLYNGPPPWQNGLAGALVHNVPVIDGREPMRRAGRFLWVDRAQGVLEGRETRRGIHELRGTSDGYRRFGVRLSRTVSMFPGGGWIVTDTADGASRRRLTVGWNLPDLPWEWLDHELRLSGENGGPWVGWGHPRHGGADGWERAGLIRAGQWIAGDPVEGPAEVWGWASPRYSVIEPCLRLVLEIRGECPLVLRTRLSSTGGWPSSLVLAWDSPSAHGP